MFQLPPGEISADEARETADRVLAGRAYVEASRPPTLQERLFEWIADQIGDFFSALSTSGGRGIISWVVIGVFVALIAFLVSRLRGVGPMPARSSVALPDIDIDADRSSAEWLKAATEAEQLGDWRAAVRCRHQALVTSLVRRGLVASRPGQTAGEIDRVVRASHPAVADQMAEATWLFKDTWYGWVEATPESSKRFAELSQIILHDESALVAS